MASSGAAWPLGAELKNHRSAGDLLASMPSGGMRRKLVLAEQGVVRHGMERQGRAMLGPARKPPIGWRSLGFDAKRWDAAKAVLGDARPGLARHGKAVCGTAGSGSNTSRRDSQELAGRLLKEQGSS